jgi:hypothetical protein
MRKLTSREWVEKAKKVHSNFYNYDNTLYKTSRIKVKIICPLHGEFEQMPTKHMTGQGCKQCHFDNLPYKLSLKTNDFINNSNLIHSNAYNYSKTICNSQYDIVTITCPIHGDFRQVAKNHRRNGCPTCGQNKNGWKTHNWHKRCDCGDKKIKLYYIRCFNKEESFFKIGLSCKKNINYRFHGNKIPYQYEILKIIESCDVDKFISMEQELKKQLIPFQYIPKIKFNGMYECFTGDFIPHFINF